MPSSISVSIIAKDNTFSQEEGANRLQWIKAENVEESVVEESKNGFDLIIAGCARGSSSIYESDALKSTDTPVLVIYPESSSEIPTEADMFQMPGTKESPTAIVSEKPIHMV
jgi:hypothetical protein